MKELSVTIRVPLPDDYFEEADLVASIRPAIADLRSKLDALGVAGITIEVDTNGPPKERAPRKPRSDVGQPRGPRASANGTDSDAPAL